MTETGVVDAKEDKPNAAGPQNDDALLKQAKRHYEEAMRIFQKNRAAWLEDQKFRAGGNQWPAKMKKQREDKGLPCLEVDKLNQYVRQVVNDARQNRPAPKVTPAEGGDVEGADFMKGLIRAIWNGSQGDEALDTSIDHAAGCGFGYIRIATAFEHEGASEAMKKMGARGFDQVLQVLRVRNALSVVLGPHQNADGSDADYGFVLDRHTKENFVLRYPNAEATNWEDEGFGGQWLDANGVLVAEYFYKVVEPGVLHLLVDGTIVTGEEYDRAVQEIGLHNVPKIEQSRDAPVIKVKWCRLTGCEVLEKNYFPGIYIPLIPVYGEEFDVEGDVIYRGLVRPAKDAQKLFNFSRSAFAQRTALTPSVPWLAAAEQIEGFDEWSTPNEGTHQVLRYRSIKPETGEPMPPPQRVSPSDVPTGFMQDMQLAEHDMQGAMGMYSASLGERSNEKSGRAIMARQREGDTGTFHYHDNQNRAVRQLCRVLVSAIPVVYDRKRVVRILGEDGKAKMVQIDPDLNAASQKQGDVTIYNPGFGRYDVDVESGPSYTTRRQETVETMMELARAVPELVKVAGDIMVRNMDWPGAQEVADRLKALLPPQLQDDGSNDSPEVKLVRQQAEGLIQQLQQQIQAAEQGIQQRDQVLAEMQQQAQRLQEQLQSKAAESTSKLMDSGTKRYEAHTERMVATAPAMDPMMISAIAEATAQRILATIVPAPGAIQ